MIKQSVNTFSEGMNKDIDKSLVSNKAYLDATNFRVITTKGNSSGALENIKGNKLIYTAIATGTNMVDTHTYLVTVASVVYKAVTYVVGSTLVCVAPDLSFTGSGYLIDTADIILAGQFIIGASEIRDNIILFTTNNIGAAPLGGRSMIYKVTITIATELQASITLLYDDNLNSPAGTLNFSTYYPIKVISRYETPNVQKVYWTDGYNNLRYANISDTATTKLTIDGTAYVNPTNMYMSVDKFEFLPAALDTKPVLTNIVGGYLPTGVVAYVYQLYLLNGAETAFSSISDPIHITADSDFKTSTVYYKGSATSGAISGKGVTLTITNSSVGFNRLRLIRLYYATLGSIPVIEVANEIEISSAASTITITDIGDVVDTLTIDEFNIASTTLFTCQDIASKDNRLFAANIGYSEFDVSDWDARAVRYRTWIDPLSPPTIYSGVTYDINADVTPYCSIANPAADDTLIIYIPNFSSYVGLPSGNYVSAINSVSYTGVGTVVNGSYLDATLNVQSFSIVTANDVVTLVSFAADTLIFTIQDTSANIVTQWTTWDTSGVGDPVTLADITINYDWEEYTPVTEAIVYDGATPLIIDTVFTDWTTNYTETHDGVNKFNDTDNDGDAEFAFKYQANGTTLGAEGPNVKIDFETEEFVLDNSNLGTTFSAGVEGTVANPSYTNFASPFKSGQLSWQRDETYRLFVVFKNTRGQLSEPKWILDLRTPSLHEDTFVNSSGANVYPWKIADKVAGEVLSYTLKPRIYFKSFPANATSARVYRVKRNRTDRSVVTQCAAIPTYASGANYYPDTLDVVNLATNGVELVKLVSPEININRNITKQSYDYLEYVTNYSGAGSTYTHADADAWERDYWKYHDNARVPYVANTRTDIDDITAIIPAAVVTDEVIISALAYHNYKQDADVAKGCSGLLANYTNTAWSAEGVANVIVNYKAKVYGSQYGGYTYEDRSRNVSIPCSDVITTTAVWHDIKYGDTFINYFEVSTLLIDLAITPGRDTMAEILYVPLESSINCDLRYHDRIETTGLSILRQEYMGEHTIGADTYNQDYDLYAYNTVYSQPLDVSYAISMTTDSTDETQFDCIIKASGVKYNGELSDSWTVFATNEEIEVDSQYGPVNGLLLLNNQLLFWQDKAFGMLSVNERSLITDNNSAQLVLGTGGVLDRFDYISNFIGCKDKFSIVNSKHGAYWFDRLANALYKYSSGDAPINLSRAKKVQSFLDSNITDTHFSVAFPSLYDDEILFTFYKSSETNGFTISYNEIVDTFVSFYSFVPTIYVPYKDKYLTTTSSHYCSSRFDRNLLYLHNSDINGRCNFYGMHHNQTAAFNTSTLKVLFNENFANNKVFDNVSYVSNTTALTGYDPTTKLRFPDIMTDTFSNIRCYDDYQNTDYVTLVYGTNLDRRERTWTFAVPRNAVTAAVSTNPDIFDPANLSLTRSYPERIRDKYMIMDLIYTNTGAYERFDVSLIGMKYRISYR